MNHKRIILCGPSCSGKTFMRESFEKRGFKCDVSHTSRSPREGEVNGVHYIFTPREEFVENPDKFYEQVEYGGNFYGTSVDGWNTSDVFIMETDGVSKIRKEDRPFCMVIYVNTPMGIRVKRMKERGWSQEKIYDRITIDEKKFDGFSDYDIVVSSGKLITGIEI